MQARELLKSNAGTGGRARMSYSLRKAIIGIVGF
jgi:hypothetical protein